MRRDEEKGVMELAERLTRSADAAHARLMMDIAGGQADRPAARRLLQDELVLRQRANALYLDAARYARPELQRTQGSLLAAVDAANARIERLQELSQVVDLFAQILALAAAVSTSRAGLIASALREVERAADETDTP